MCIWNISSLFLSSHCNITRSEFSELLQGIFINYYAITCNRITLLVTDLTCS